MNIGPEDIFMQFFAGCLALLFLPLWLPALLALKFAQVLFKWTSLL